MATNPIGGSLSPVITPNKFPPAAAVRVAGRLLNRHSAHEIAEAIEVLVDLLDMLGGDPDIEPNGDELDGDGGEDCFGKHRLSRWDGPGCPIGDPGGCEHDGREEAEEG